MKKKATKKNAVLKKMIAEKGPKSTKNESGESKKAQFMEMIMAKKASKMDGKGGKKC